MIYMELILDNKEKSRQAAFLADLTGIYVYKIKALLSKNIAQYYSNINTIHLTNTFKISNTENISLLQWRNKNIIVTALTSAVTNFRTMIPNFKKLI